MILFFSVFCCELELSHSFNALRVLKQLRQNQLAQGLQQLKLPRQVAQNNQLPRSHLTSTGIMLSWLDSSLLWVPWGGTIKLVLRRLKKSMTEQVKSTNVFWFLTVG